jgi:hypothetical protein
VSEGTGGEVLKSARPATPGLALVMKKQRRRGGRSPFPPRASQSSRSLGMGLPRPVSGTHSKDMELVNVELDSRTCEAGGRPR